MVMINSTKLSLISSLKVTLLLRR